MGEPRGRWAMESSENEEREKKGMKLIMDKIWAPKRKARRERRAVPFLCRDGGEIMKG